MAGRRRVAPEIQKLFEKYTPEGSVARRLPRADALRLLSTEYDLQGPRAEELLNHFDADQNGYMSLWEFQHFVNIIGPRAAEIVSQFEAAAGGVADAVTLTSDQVRAVLDSYYLPDGQLLTDKEKDFFMKSSSADMGGFTLGQFADFLARFRMYKRPEKK